MMRVFTVSVFILPLVAAFQPPLLSRKAALTTRLQQSTKNVEDSFHHDITCNMDRRQFAAAGLLSGLGLFVSSPETAFAADAPGTSPDHPIVVLGAGGKVGKICTQILAKQGLHCRAVTRQGRQVLEKESPYVTYAAADVTKFDTLQAALQGADGCIFAASASGKKKGGDPAHVDYLGAYNAAMACIEANVPKLVLISSGTTTRPDSAGFQATNFFVKFIYGENIMNYKIAGETAVRNAYAAADKPGVAYTVLRPGGLTDEEPIGPSTIHVSQGDVFSSEISRADIAQVTVAAVLKGKETDNTTFEVNQQKGLYKCEATLPDLPDKLIHTGQSSYSALLSGLLTDKQMLSSYPGIVSTFTGGNKIEPLSKLS